jgi:MoxR-like ATPase
VRPEIGELQRAMEAEGYVADPTIATALFLAREMRRPLLVEGEAGVGKTEIAKVLARLLGTELIRLQCYEGLDVSTALYEWDYQRQLLRLRLAEREGRSAAETEDLIFGRDYLLERPLLAAISRREGPAVLLIDEIDRADDGFEAFLLEVLSDFQVTIPELGTIRAEHVPLVVLTSNRTREIGDALRRRCLYLYVEHPSLAKEVRILRLRVPDAGERLARAVAGFVQELRRRPLAKAPGVAESIDWAQALVHLHRDRLDAETVGQTLGCLLKDRDDLAGLGGEEVATLVAAGERAAGEEEGESENGGGALAADEVESRDEAHSARRAAGVGG